MQRGFLLIELIISCMIIGSIIMLTFANYTAIKDDLILKESIDELILDIRELQVSSINNIEADRMIIFQAKPPEYHVVKGTKILKTYKYPLKVYFLREPDTIQFNLRGIPISGAQTISLVIEGTNKIKTITIVPVTGRIAIVN